MSIIAFVRFVASLARMLKHLARENKNHWSQINRTIGEQDELIAGALLNALKAFKEDCNA